MKGKPTEVVFVLDKSGSMTDFVDDTIGGFNAFIEEQKKIEGQVNVSLFLFNHKFKTLFIEKPLNEINELTEEDYSVDGMTALLDATGKAINKMGNIFSGRDDENKPEHVIFCLTTDGQENSSKEFTKEKIRDMIEHQESKYNWQFNFFGANIDSFSEAKDLGISSSRTVNFDYTSAGTRSLYSAFSSTVSDVRKDGEAKTSMEDYYKKAKGE